MPAGQKPLRIAIFSDSCLPILNGVSVSIDALVRELRRQGHSVHIFTASHFRHKDSDPNSYRFPATETPWTKGYPLAFPPFYPMVHFFRKHKFDIVHTHTPWTIGFVGMRWAQSHGIPIVSTYHTHYDKYTHYIPFVPKRYLRYKIAKHTNYYYNRVAHVITPSDASKRWLLRHSIHTPISVIPTGTPSRRPLTREGVREQLGIDPKKRILLYVGRIAKEKNMEVLFHAAAKIFETHKDAEFWLVGDGPYRDSAVELARNLNMGDRTNFVGFVERQEVDKFYACADIFLFGSMTETQGLVVSEAMSYGLPCVVVTGGGASASIIDGENGYIVRNDADEIRHHVNQMLTDQDLYERISKASKLTVQGLTIESMTKAVLSVYAQVLHEHAVHGTESPDDGDFLYRK